MLYTYIPELPSQLHSSTREGNEYPSVVMSYVNTREINKDLG